MSIKLDFNWELKTFDPHKSIFVKGYQESKCDKPRTLTLAEYLAANRDLPIFQWLEAGEKITLVEGVFLLDENLHTSPILSLSEPVLSPSYRTRDRSYFNDHDRSNLIIKKKTHIQLTRPAIDNRWFFNI